MHSPNLTLALAGTYVADLERTATRPTARATRRRDHRRRRALARLGLAATAALSAVAPTGALARPSEDAAAPANAHVQGAIAPKPAQDLRALAKTSSLAGTTAGRAETSTNGASQIRQDPRSPDARDAAEGRGTFNGPQVVVVKTQPRTRPAPATGIDWADAGIGAAGLGLSMAAVGGGLILVGKRRHRRYATR
jgi:hypothetical protein